MKATAKSNWSWYLLSPLFFRYVHRRIGLRRALRARLRAGDIYCRWLTEAPEIGPDNPMNDNLIIVLIFFSFYEADDRRMSESELRTVISEMMNLPPLRLTRLIDLNRPLMMRLMKRMIYKNVRWLKAHPQYAAASWDFSFDPSRHRDGIYFWFTRCPINTFCREHDLLDVLPLCCDIDHLNVERVHGRLVRHHTLATGGDICDYWITGDKTRLPQ